MTRKPSLIDRKAKFELYHFLYSGWKPTSMVLCLLSWFLPHRPQRMFGKQISH